MSKFSFPYLLTEARSAISSALHNPQYVGDFEFQAEEERRLFDRLEYLLGDELENSQFIREMQSWLEVFNISEDKVKNLALLIERQAASCMPFSALKQGDSMTMVLVTLTDSGSQEYTMPVYIEHDEGGLTLSQLEGVLVSSFGAAIYLVGPDDALGASYWTDTNNKLEVAITSHTFSKDSEVIALTESTTGYVFRA